MLVCILTLNILKNYSLFLSWEMCSQFRDWDPGKRAWKKKVRLASLTPFTEMRFMQEKMRTMKRLCHAFCALCPGKWFVFVWGFSRFWKCRFMCKFILWGFSKFYQLSEYYRATIKLKCKMSILGVFFWNNQNELQHLLSNY